MLSWGWVEKTSSKTVVPAVTLPLSCNFQDEKVMQKRFPAIWKPVGVTQVSTYTKKVTLLDLGRSRLPDTASQLRLAPPKRLTMEEEKDSNEDWTGARGSVVSVDSELD